MDLAVTKPLSQKGGQARQDYFRVVAAELDQPPSGSFRHPGRKFLQLPERRQGEMRISMKVDLG
jgi:hypothetical protein